MRRVYIYMPFLLGLVLAIGILLGAGINKKSIAFGSEQNAMQKIKAVLGYVQDNYVDSVNPEKLLELTLVDLLQHLDPHSDYFTSEQVKKMSVQMKGSFEGIGIEYNFLRDTLVVLAIVPGGPSEKSGIEVGDRIVFANGKLIVGKKLDEKFVQENLRGEKGTKVSLKIKRASKFDMFDISISRGSVPVSSVDGAYMLNAEVGYLKLAVFSENSFDEFKKASQALLGMGMKKIVLDLRGNGGGYLAAAISIADEFLSDGNMIVYTEGRQEGIQKSFATRQGILESIPIVVLVDENSASASEIIAGAIQDNDRGTIVGRRTFGKGLVQEEKKLADGSAFRLTIARYYTPVGRCIQKPYDKGIVAYETDLENRLKQGELINRDSIHFSEQLKFTTPGGKTVYGGGGIMPDLFIPIDTNENLNGGDEVLYRDVFILWSLEYYEKHKTELVKLGLKKFRSDFLLTDAMVNELISLGESMGFKKPIATNFKSSLVVRKYMKAFIAKNTWGNLGFLQIWNENDNFLHNSLSYFNK